MNTYHARLENWVLFYGKINGDIYDDTKNRFVDGTNVTTSTINNCEIIAEGQIIETRNSVYLLGKHHETIGDAK